MYQIAAWTGYRKGEIGSLKADSFRFGGEPTVTVEANYSKRKRTDRQALHPELANRVEQWLATVQPGSHDLLFPISKRSGGTERKTAKMMRIDLAAARATWLDEGEPDERDSRMASNFLCYEDSQGRFADFHSASTSSPLVHRPHDERLHPHGDGGEAERDSAARSILGVRWECAGVSNWQNRTRTVRRRG